MPDLRPEELGELIKERDSGSLDKINSQYGGVKGIAKSLQTDTKKGLSDNDVEARKKDYGENRLPKPKPKSFFAFLFAAMKDKTLIILMISAIVSIVLGVLMPPPDETRSTGWIEGTAILVAVLIVSFVTAANDFSKDRKFLKLSAEAENRTIKVIRNGQKKEISVFDIVVGDIVQVDTGDYIPADLLFISGEGLSSDESPMTGEPEAVTKSEQDPFLLGGCMVTAGTAKTLCIAVGKNSQWGQIKASLEKPETTTQLQDDLEHLAEKIGKFGVAAAVVTFIALCARWSIQKFAIDHDAWDWKEVSVLVNFLINSITIIVVAVPEGLPLAVTLSLAYSMVQMMKDQNLVRHLAACETMGGATNICSDKTGTLTQNKMTVVKYWLASKMYDEEEGEKAEDIDEKVKEIFAESISINSTAYLSTEEEEKKKKEAEMAKLGKNTDMEEKKSDKKDKKEDKAKSAVPEAKKNERKVVGTKTEGALLILAEKLGSNYEEIRNANEIQKVYPFSSKKKRMSTVMKTKESGLRLHVKGASETILELSTKALNEKGEPQELTEELRQKLSKQIEEWASEGYRTLCLAYLDLPNGSQVPEEDKEQNGPLDKDLTLIALVGIEDPIRPEVIDAVKNCQHAGITVRMVTGDNILTAKNIASQCGIMTEDGEAIEGPKFRKLSEQELEKLIPKLQVVARCSPEDKLILVKKLRKMGEVVACTGDGSNDAPILREADVGFAMGISGTEVAKDACDIVLLDDNFSSIEKAVLWGRNVYDSIRKFVQFQLTVNVVAVVTSFVGAVTTGESPLGAMQMLWVNLTMDTMASLALATQRPAKDLLDRPPYGRKVQLISPRMWRNILGQAAFQLSVIFVILYIGNKLPYIGIPDDKSDPIRSTIIFNTFVFLQVFNEINSRKLGNEINVFSGFFTNWVFLAVVGFTVTIQAILVQFGGAFVKTVPLDWKQWIFCVVVGFMAIPIGMLLRLVPVKPEAYKKKVDKKDKKKKNIAEIEHEEEDEIEISHKKETTPLLKREQIPSDQSGRDYGRESVRISINDRQSQAAYTPRTQARRERSHKNWEKVKNAQTISGVVSWMRSGKSKGVKYP
eukprot:TRINITY_DN413_c0_g1_i3.p1 TRINITY_DN413_c0_g1~~TRINITY_DN413_c0_g1_i3.p1  ORF type:complete len:1090 (+),score=320.14 TRINITY_DN413_c0_g1_i3:237-3506(+)